MEAKPIGKGHKAITSMRGSYGGVLMFGMLTSVAGLGMFNPLSLGAGLLLGRKTYKEDMENRMMRVCAVKPRQICGGSSMTCCSWWLKNSRSAEKYSATTADRYRGIADQTTRSLNESLQPTIAAARLEETERLNRIRELERQLNILGQVIDNAEKLTATAAGTASGSR